MPNLVSLLLFVLVVSNLPPDHVLAWSLGPRTTLWPWCQVSTCRLTGASGAAAGQHTQPLRPRLTQPHPRSPVPTPALPQPHPTSRWLHGRRFVRRQTISQTAFELFQVKEPEVDWWSPGGFAPGEAGWPPASDSSDYYQGILAWPGSSRKYNTSITQPLLAAEKHVSTLPVPGETCLNYQQLQIA